MLQQVVSSVASASSSSFAPVALRAPFASRPLEEIFRRVRLSLVEFNAQDIYQICAVAYNMDNLAMMQDPEFMRGLHAAFQRSDQTVISPFQANLVADTFRKANIIAMPKDVALPEEDAVSPESLLNVIRQMNITKTRDERKIEKVLLLMFPMLDEFTPSQLSLTIAELSRIQCVDKQFMARLAKRILQASDDLNTLDVSLTAMSLACIPGIQHNLLVQLFQVVEDRSSEFLPEDYINVLRGLNVLGSKFVRVFGVLVQQGLAKVESMDAVLLTHFLTCFVTMDYRNREHIEIFADALVELAEDLSERDLVQAFIALQRLNLLSQPVFGALAAYALHYSKRMDPRNIAPIMDICSSVSYNSELLMKSLLDRAAELTRALTPAQLGDILEIVCLYPPAREHPLVQLFGKQCRMRFEIMSPPALASAVKGLANLGYSDPELYSQAAETFFRFGFKDFSLLEPILQGLCLSGTPPPPVMAKVLASHLAPMAHSMSLHEVERANRYLTHLRIEDEWVYRQLAARVLNFIKEVTPDMPQELQILMQKGAAALHAPV